MIPKRIIGTTNKFTKPEGWTREQCVGLNVRAQVLDNGAIAFSSAWEPTPAELAALNDGGHVILTVVGQQPPVKITVEADGAEVAA